MNVYHRFNALLQEVQRAQQDQEHFDGTGFSPVTRTDPTQGQKERSQVG